MKTWIINGLVMDFATNKTIKQNIVIENGIITALTTDAPADTTDCTTIIDAKGQVVSPGFIDVHVHLREPGFEHKETIATGTASAAKGGYTTICCMPNTRPVIDTVETVQFIQEKAKAANSVKVLPYGCITKGQLGREMTDMEALRDAGIFAFTDDGVGVQSAQMMKDAMTKAKALGLPVVAHCEDETLVKGAPAHDGVFAQKMGFKGIPSSSEAIHVGRDILLAEETGVHYHVCHVSTEQSVRLIRLGKQIGVHVTAEVCPHHLLLSDEDIPSDDANWKMNPPLRTPNDVKAVLEALEEGVIDMIVTDHAPHAADEKAKGFQLAPFGIIGFETAFPLLYTKFVRTGRWTLEFLLSRMTQKPSEVFNMKQGQLTVGAPADLVILDLETPFTVDINDIASKSKNTPFIGWELYGQSVLTMVDGLVVYSK